jgi:hypothetical protein
VSDPPKNVVVLGSTGSVGTQTLDVVRSMPDRFRVLGLSGHSHWELLAQQAGEFAPRAVAVTHPPAAGARPPARGGARGLRRSAALWTAPGSSASTAATPSWSWRGGRTPT